MDDAPDLGPDDLLDALANRYSFGPKQLVAPAVSAEHLRQAVRLALRAPDHQGLQPFRFVHVDAAQRERLGELFAQAAQRRGLDAAEIATARRRAANGPTLVALVVRLRDDVEEVPRHEQWLCAGAALMNFLNALHLLGYGAKVVGGATLRDAALQAAFCHAPGETLAAWVLAGTPARSAQGRPEPPIDSVWSHWAD
jgi:nitroreductase